LSWYSGSQAMLHDREYERFVALLIEIKNNVKAYVFSRTGAGGTWTAEGDEFMGWKVKSINGTGASLAQQGRSTELRLYPPE
jgi:hypothetical protein